MKTGKMKKGETGDRQGGEEKKRKERGRRGG